MSESQILNRTRRRAAWDLRMRRAEESSGSGGGEGVWWRDDFVRTTGGLGIGGITVQRVTTAYAMLPPVSKSG